MVLVVGSRNSSNSNRLSELAEQQGIKSYLIDGPDDIQPDWLENCQRVGVTAGASAPEVLVQQVIARLKELGGKTAQEVQGRKETIVFSLPPALRRAVRTQPQSATPTES